MDAPEAITTTGPVRGRWRQGVALFAGIPYAAPPVGALRFRPPQPAEAWDTPRDCTRFSKAAPQRAGEGLTNAVEIPWDEGACLTVNVTTPAPDGRRRPVFVWIHGGDYKNGTGATPWYDGTSFAANGDIVVVSLNYRLGSFGFAELSRWEPDNDRSGLVGLFDQIAALEWVRDNIAAFGGDPARITIAGESAGGFSVATLLALAEASGLFHQAVIQSGSAQAVLDGAVAVAVTELLMEVAHVDGVGGLRGLSADDLLEAQVRVQELAAKRLGTDLSPFYPSTGSPCLAEPPITAITAGASADIPVLMGTNADESTLFGVGQIADDRLEGWISRFHPEPGNLLACYRRARPDATAGELAVAIHTDWMFRVPSVRLAEARGLSPTWMYRFDWKSRAFGGALGATHALEIPFVFDTLDRAGVDAMLGPGPRPDAVSAAMHAAWTAFIHHGDPNVEGLPPWPAYEAGDRSVLAFDDEPTLLAGPDSVELDAWSGVR